MIQKIKISVVYQIGKILADKHMLRKKYDYAYKNRGMKRIKCNFNRQESEHLRNQARKARVQPATYLKRIYHAYHTHQALFPPETDNKISSLLFLIRNIANNINQIAYRTNTFKKVAFGDMLKTKQNVHELEKIVKTAFMQ